MRPRKEPKPRKAKYIVCEKCGHNQVTNKPIVDVKYPSIMDQVSGQLSFPIRCEFTHLGFWVTSKDGLHEFTNDQNCIKNSVMISPKSLFYVYKIALRHLLLSMKMIEPAEIDSANLVPHVVVRKNPTDPFSKYDLIQNRQIQINVTDLSAKKDFLIMELDKKQNLHMTLIYAKGIGKRTDLIQAMINVIKLLNYQPNLIEQYKALPYFGHQYLSYWYDTGDLYPNNFIIPDDFHPHAMKEAELTPVTSAGSMFVI